MMVLTAVMALAATARTRWQQPLGGAWQFVKSDVEHANSDTQWQEVSIPHSWNASDGCTPRYFRGNGTYRYCFDAPNDIKGKRVVIHFEGVSQHARVYVNGNLAAEHKGAFTAFTADATPFLKPKGNELLVRVSNALDETIIPLAGDFTVFGGIYRPVYLEVAPANGITLLDHATKGVYIKQNEVSADKARIEVKARVDLTADVKHRLSLHVTATDGCGSSVDVSGGSMKRGTDFYEISLPVTIPNPHLWNGKKDAAMYSCNIQLMDGNNVIDEVTEQIGLRSCHIDHNKGFYLNGESYPLRGVNRHQDRQDKGWAITNDDHDQDMAMIKEIGANTIRLAHYPHSQYFYSLCDREGMLVWAEIPFVEKGTRNNAEFDANTCNMLVELIRQSYNHPSIFCWSLYNELGEGTNPELLVARLNDLAHREDPTRITVGATNNAGRPENRIPDAVGHNTYPGWYWSDPTAMKWTIAWNYKPDSGKSIAISEYGAGASIHHHDQHVKSAPKTDGEWHPEEWQAFVHECNYREIDKSPMLWGTFVWNMFDFASAGRHEGDAMGINDKGLVTYDRKVRKDAFYFYKAQWNPEPMAHICSQRDVERKEALTDVKVYSNCNNPVLTVNGTTYQLQDNGYHTWTAHGVQLSKGDNNIVVHTDEGATDSCVWVLK
ncbi:MAG: glycoside hydrolase family 2 [Bacteroidales bacterium]|nr:glycoside hydrolase family 2 [Candidatus Sodaliphilus aphodohippi]